MLPHLSSWQADRATEALKRATRFVLSASKRSDEANAGKRPARTRGGRYSAPLKGSGDRSAADGPDEQAALVLTICDAASDNCAANLIEGTLYRSSLLQLGGRASPDSHFVLGLGEVCPSLPEGKEKERREGEKGRRREDKG